VEPEEVEALEELHGGQEGLALVIGLARRVTGRRISPESTTPTTLSKQTYRRFQESSIGQDIEVSDNSDNYPTLTYAVRVFGIVSILGAILLAVKSCTP